MNIADKSWWRDYVPRRFRDYRLETSPRQDLVPAVQAWLNGEPLDTGRNLVLLGSTGTGKTGLAVGAMHVMHELGTPTLIVNVPEWLQQQRPNHDGSNRSELAVSVGLLVLDDIGAEKTSEWVQERLYSLINHRYEDELPTIATSNLMDFEALAASIGRRAASRLFESADVIAVTGADMRLADEVPA